MKIANSSEASRKLCVDIQNKTLFDQKLPWKPENLRRHEDCFTVQGCTL